MATLVDAYAPQSRLVAVEANVAPFRNMYKHLMVNAGLLERVTRLLAAVMSSERLANHQGPLVLSNHTWRGPFLCDDGSDKGGSLDTVSTMSVSNSSCSLDDSRVPIITIDMIVSAQPKGMLFFVKMDLEGAEFEALNGGKLTFSDPENRPCIVMIELKLRDGKPYKKALDFLVDMGYTDYEDIDSGIEGEASWPPLGRLFDGEGNYEFRLPKKELEMCVDRVLGTSQHT